MPEDRPSFPCYAKEWIASTRGLTHAARGVYWDMLCFAWLNDGCPADLEELRLQLGVERADWRRIWPKLEPKWEERNGRLYNERLEYVREETRAYTESKVLAGKASAAARRKKHGTAQPPNRTSNSVPNTAPNRTSNTPSNSPPSKRSTHSEPASASALTDQDTKVGDHSVAGYAPPAMGFAPPTRTLTERQRWQLAEGERALQLVEEMERRGGGR